MTAFSNNYYVSMTYSYDVKQKKNKTKICPLNPYNNNTNDDLILEHHPTNSSKPTNEKQKKMKFKVNEPRINIFCFFFFLRFLFTVARLSLVLGVMYDVVNNFYFVFFCWLLFWLNIILRRWCVFECPIFIIFVFRELYFVLFFFVFVSKFVFIESRGFSFIGNKPKN